MRITILIAVLLLPFFAHAQLLKGTVMDGESAKPLHGVNITNLTTGMSTYTNKDGTYTLEAKNGDAITFVFLGYHASQKLTPVSSGVAEMKIEMLPLSVQLKEYVFHDYSPYQKDSAALADMYSTELTKKPIKPKIEFNGGIAVDGLIGAAVQRMSKSYKKNKAFKAAFKKDEEQKFIDTRYTPVLVTKLTGLTTDTLALFMNAYPMDYDFARAATDLELKGWIRNNYKEYLHNDKVLRAPLADNKQ